jgi:hypothetical protein
VTFVNNRWNGTKQVRRMGNKKSNKGKSGKCETGSFTKPRVKNE